MYISRSVVGIDVKTACELCRHAQIKMCTVVNIGGIVRVGFPKDVPSVQLTYLGRQFVCNRC